MYFCLDLPQLGPESLGKDLLVAKYKPCSILPTFLKRKNDLETSNLCNTLRFGGREILFFSWFCARMHKIRKSVVKRASPLTRTCPLEVGVGGVRVRVRVRAGVGVGVGVGVRAGTGRGGWGGRGRGGRGSGREGEGLGSGPGEEGAPGQGTLNPGHSTLEVMTSLRSVCRSVGQTSSDMRPPAVETNWHPDIDRPTNQRTDRPTTDRQTYVIYRHADRQTQTDRHINPCMLSGTALCYTLSCVVCVVSNWGWDNWPVDRRSAVITHGFHDLLHHWRQKLKRKYTLLLYRDSRSAKHCRL